MPEVLNEIERDILDYMVSYLRSHTYQPSIREIGQRFGIKSTKTVSEHLKALAEKGFLERDPARSRGVRILGMDLHPDAMSLPVFRGLPESREELDLDIAEERLTLDRSLAGAKGAFLLRVTSDDLAGLGVRADDLVLIEPLPLAELPDGSVVLVRGEHQPVRFRRLVNRAGQVALAELRGGAEPEPVRSAERLEIIGRLAGFWRPFRQVDSGVHLTAH